MTEYYTHRGRNSMKFILYILGIVILLVTIANVKNYAFSYSFSYDEECANRIFDKYLKDAQPEFDKYLDKASNLYDSISPESESEINNYMDRLNPLAEDYIDNLQPYAENYVDELGTCMK
jgi:hypothetical protein